MNEPICTYLKMFNLISFLLVVLSLCTIFWPSMSKASSSLKLPELTVNQTANLRVVFLGIPPEYIEESEFLSSISQNISQFAYPNTIKWSLNVSIFIHEFPESVLDSLSHNAFHSEGTVYYNITLLDLLLGEFDDLTIPKHGYLMVFMWIPENAVNHLWFHVQERPDLFLGRIDYFNGVPFKHWASPPNFGGISGALYFDMSEVMEKASTKQSVTNTVIDLFNNGLVDMFPSLLGAEDSRMIVADMQRYENYKVEVLWLNGTGEQFYSEQIKESFENLMPWTNWTITIETRVMDAALNYLIESRTEELSEPLTY